MTTDEFRANIEKLRSASDETLVSAGLDVAEVRAFVRWCDSVPDHLDTTISPRDGGR